MGSQGKEFCYPSLNLKSNGADLGTVEERGMTLVNLYEWNPDLLSILRSQFSSHFPILTYNCLIMSYYLTTNLKLVIVFIWTFYWPLSLPVWWLTHDDLSLNRHASSLRDIPLDRWRYDLELGILLEVGPRSLCCCTSSCKRWIICQIDSWLQVEHWHVLLELCPPCL